MGGHLSLGMLTKKMITLNLVARYVVGQRDIFVTYLKDHALSNCLIKKVCSRVLVPTPLARHPPYAHILK